MDYKEFCEHVKDEIKGVLPEQYESYEVQLHTVSKPNVGLQVGLTFVSPVSGKELCKPGTHILHQAERLRH